MNPLDFLLRNPTGRDAGNTARQRLNARTAVPKSGGGVPRATGGFLANPIFAAYAIPGYSEQKSRNAAGVIEGTRGPLNELQYIGKELLGGRIPYSKPLNAIETGKHGPTDWNPSANPRRVPTTPVPSSGAADRAYRQELSRTAQLTAQDPELQRYESARSTAKTQEEMNAVRDEGMRIWAAKHGGLAAKVKPGSTGYEAIQGVSNPATASFLNNEQVLGTQSFDPNTALSTAQQIQGQVRPNQALTDQEILAAQSYDPNIAMSSAENIAFAPTSPAEAGMLKAVGGAQGEYITPMSTTTFANPLEQRKAIFQELLNRARARGK